MAHYLDHLLSKEELAAKQNRARPKLTLNPNMPYSGYGNQPVIVPNGATLDELLLEEHRYSSRMRFIGIWFVTSMMVAAVLFMISSQLAWIVLIAGAVSSLLGSVIMVEHLGGIDVGHRKSQIASLEQRALNALR